MICITALIRMRIKCRITAILVTGTMGLINRNLILDGRIISSDVVWTNANGMSSEEAWIQNYAHRLGLRGGGLVLGTAHSVFQSGINNIDDRIGVSQFNGFFGGPQAVVVDPLSPLFVPALDACRADPSTTVLTIILQPVLLQLAYRPMVTCGHLGRIPRINLDAWNLAAVSHNMESIAFGTCGGLAVHTMRGLL
ncbi:hypothetical protein [Nitrosomonas aestuarii]|uniref:hypothetical protein n=1 Tax=Nitrosomonas aestuarii TaxID=52441 RepID=UPI000D313312|nr:hypothetical protein [Nitrosomonas aestuarii]PTN12716.1 hypothetical protein C8R11_103285 [Nitrosomonas aestuarii]